MSEFSPDRDNTLEGLHELFSSATHDASAAMCSWTNGLINVALNDVREIPLEEVSTELNIDDDLLTMVVLTLRGELGGTLILVFDDVNGRQLAASLLRREVAITPDWTELEKSALTETGNILGCAYINALTRLLGKDVVPSPPYFIQDYGISVIEQAIMEQAQTTNSMLLCDIRFQRRDEDLAWRVVFVPTVPMREAMERSIHATS